MFDQMTFISQHCVFLFLLKKCHNIKGLVFQLFSSAVKKSLNPKTISNKALYTCLSDLFWQLFNLAKDKIVPITGLEFDRMPSDSMTEYKYYILATTPGYVQQTHRQTDKQTDTQTDRTSFYVFVLDWFNEKIKWVPEKC